MSNSLIKSLLSCLVDQLLIIETAGNTEINPDFGIDLMEMVAADIKNITQEDLDVLKRVLREMAVSEDHAMRRVFLENFLENFGGSS